MLGHASDTATIHRYIAEMFRAMKPGSILIFQLAWYVPLRKRLQPRRRLHHMLRALGFDKRFLYERPRCTRSG